MHNMHVKKYFYDSENGTRTWRSCEANDLIEVFESHYYLFGVMPSDEDVWILMASALQRRGIDVTARQVHRKWIRMRSTFHNISNCKRTIAPKLCRHLRCNEDFTDEVNKKNKITVKYCSSIFKTEDEQMYENMKQMYELSFRI